MGNIKVIKALLMSAENDEDKKVVKWTRKEDLDLIDTAWCIGYKEHINNVGYSKAMESFKFSKSDMFKMNHNDKNQEKCKERLNFHLKKSPKLENLSFLTEKVKQRLIGKTNTNLDFDQLLTKAFEEYIQFRISKKLKMDPNCDIEAEKQSILRNPLKKCINYFQKITNQIMQEDNPEPLRNNVTITFEESIEDPSNISHHSVSTQSTIVDNKEQPAKKKKKIMRLQGEPKAPPLSLYNLYVQNEMMNLKDIESKHRMGIISQKYKEISLEEKIACKMSLTKK